MTVRLTKREREVLLLRMEGQQVKEIAARLQIAIPTVKTHLWHIASKAGGGTTIDILNRLTPGRCFTCRHGLAALLLPPTPGRGRA